MAKLFETRVKPYSSAIESAMKEFYRSLNHAERRLFAAMEAAELGPGGVDYVAGLLGCSQADICQGMTEMKAYIGANNSPLLSEKQLVARREMLNDIDRIFLQTLRSEGT